MYPHFENDKENGPGPSRRFSLKVGFNGEDRSSQIPISACRKSLAAISMNSGITEPLPKQRRERPSLISNASTYMWK